MKKNPILLILASLIITAPVRAEFGLYDKSDFTGDSFFVQAGQSVNKSETYTKSSSKNVTIPPLKRLRLRLQEMRQESMSNELAPTAPKEVYEGETETSEYASKELKDEFGDMQPDGFDADEETVSEAKKRKLFKKHKKQEAVEQTEDIILDCDKVDYDTPNYLVYATGNVSVEFVKQKTVVKAEKITFDRINNTIKAEGDVRIIKNGKVVTGDYIFVDMNEENALIENPVLLSTNLEIRAKKGYVYGDKIVQENGSITLNENYPIDFHSAGRGPQMRRMLVKKEDTLSDDIEKGRIKFTAQTIKVTQKGDLETIAIKKGRLYKDGKIVFKVPAVKFYTNKNHDYIESNIWEIGSYRGLGLYTGPGWVFELPKGSVLKAMPIFNYKSGAGIGGLARFSSGTNNTIAGYGTAASKFIVYGKQELDDNLFLQYGVNSYLDEWFLGRRRPKYGVSLAYNKNYETDNFLVKNKRATFGHRLDVGYYQDMEHDIGSEKMKGSGMGTPRFRYMARGEQYFYDYVNEEKLTAFALGVRAEMAASVYGTGDTQTIGRVGPVLHSQYKRWMQDIGYYLSKYHDDTPMPLYDAYRYGKQNLYLREYIQLCRWLTISWFGSINLSNDAPNHKTYQENAFYISVGPDDVKLNLGYDFIRENLYCTLEMMMDAKGAKVEYDTFELKQDKKPKKDTLTTKAPNAYEAPTQPKVLQKAVVENVKVMEDVL